MLTSDSILKTRNRVHRCRFAQVCYPSRRRGSPLEKSRLFGICGNGQIAARGLGSCVERVCERSPREMLHSVLSDVLRFKGKGQQRDDITLVTARRVAADQPFLDDTPTVRRRLLDPDENTDMGSLA